MNKFQVIKHSGELVDFDLAKLKSALIRSGANLNELDRIMAQIVQKLQEGMSTRKIYQIAYAVLRKESHNVAGRYRLKKAVLDLGPSGYPFEKFVGRLFRNMGYQVQVGQIVPGKCVKHEVDVVGKKGHKQVYVECKFHKDRRKNDVKIPMYIKSRFDDIEDKLRSFSENKKLEIEGVLVTNTRFTTDAQDFGRCAGMTLISWDYPAHGNLRDWIDQAGFHPITSLSSLSQKNKQLLLEKDVILCREIQSHQHVLSSIGLSSKHITKILKEAQEVIKYQK